MATYYWVGGSGSWDNTSSARWSATSGGAGGAGVPTANDAVIFNSASSGAGYTVQVSQFTTCASITATAPAAGNITFSNTVANDGCFATVGSFSGVATSINIYNGAVFTKGASTLTPYMLLTVYCTVTGTVPITFNNSASATQPLYIEIYQATQSTITNTVNFCNGHTQTFTSVNIRNNSSLYFSGYETQYNTFNCTSATILISGGFNGYEYFGFGYIQTQDSFTITTTQYVGAIVLTNTSITIGAAATSSTATYGGAFFLNANSSTYSPSFSCAGTSISILRPVLSVPNFIYYFYIPTYYSCSTQFANITLSNGYDTTTSGYAVDFGNVQGITGNLVVSNTVSSPNNFYLKVNPIINSNFTIGGTTTVTAAYIQFIIYYGYNLTHTGAVSVVGSALSMSTYGCTTNGTVTFSSTLSSTNPTTNTSDVHNIIFTYAALVCVGNVSLVDTAITAYSITTTGAANTWTHNTANGLSSNGATIYYTVSLTKGITTLTKAIYTLPTSFVTQAFAALTLIGSSIDVYPSTDITTGNLRLQAYSATLLSTLGARTLTVTGTLVTTDASASTSTYNFINVSSNIVVSSTVNLEDTLLVCFGSITSGTYIHINAASSPAYTSLINNRAANGFFTSGSISITRAIYTVTDTLTTGGGGISAINLSGASLVVTGALTAGIVTLANATTQYSYLYNSNSSVLSALNSTSSSIGSHSVQLNSLVIGSVSLVDTTFTSSSTTNVSSTWTQTKTATGTTTGSNVFGGNATFGGNTSFTNSDIVFLGQTNSVTGTFTFIIGSNAVPVSTGNYATNDNPGITFLYTAAAPTFSVSSSFTITGSTTNRTNVRTFVPYINAQPIDLRYRKVTISVASVSLSYVNFQNVTASGATPWTGTALGNATGNTNITFATGTTRFLVASSGTVQSNTAIWANSSGGATSLNNYPLPQDTIVVDNNSASAGAVTLNFASVIYATNLIGQASINRSVTFSRSDRSSLILLGNITIDTPAAGGLVFDLLNITLANESSASAHVLSWPAGYVPIATSNTVQLNPYSLGSMTLSGSTSTFAYLQSIGNGVATPVSGSYGTFTITDGVVIYANVVQIANTTANSSNLTSSIIYTTSFIVAAAATSAYTLGPSYSTFFAGLSTVTSNYVGNLNLAPTLYDTVNVNVPSIGNLSLSINSPTGGFVFINFASCVVGSVTGGGSSAGGGSYVYLSELSPGPATITKAGGGVVQLNWMFINTLNAAPANTFYATNSINAGLATGWTFSAAPGGAAGGNFFLEF
jgi:hypothetical protein